MKNFKKPSVRSCFHVVFLSLLFWVGCQSVAYAQIIVDCPTPFDCGWDELIAAIDRLIDFGMLIAAPLAAIAFVWAGVLYLTAAGNEGQIKKAHGIFKSVLIGFILVLSAWLIVKLILNTFAPSISSEFLP